MAIHARQITGWDRPSQILLEGLLLAVMVLAVALNAVGLIGLFTVGETSVPVRLDEQTLASASNASLVTSQGDLLLAEPTTGQLLLLGAPMVLGAAVVTGAAYSLYQVVRSLRTGVPFHRRNATRLIRAALIVLFGGAVIGLVDMLSTMALGMDGQELMGPGSPIVASGSFPLTFIGIGLLLLCLAEFFRRGTELHDDVEGLV